MDHSPAPSAIATAELRTPVGRVAVAVSEAGACQIRWCTAEDLAARLGGQAGRAPERTDAVLGQLAEYFGGARRTFALPLDWRGTTQAQRAVLATLYEFVPHGSAVTYGELAALSGTGIPARAIGGIMARNPLPIVVPCHRVLGHGGLGGYSGGSGGDGLEVKRWLLTLEGVLPPTLDWDPAGLPGPP